MNSVSTIRLSPISTEVLYRYGYLDLAVSVWVLRETN